MLTRQIFAVIYEANVGGGLYIEANDEHSLEGTELTEGLVVLNEFRAREGKASLGTDAYTGDSPQRMYRATIQKMSVNISERDEKGNIIRDYRREISKVELFDRVA